jgi:hypothetical protein
VPRPQSYEKTQVDQAAMVQFLTEQRGLIRTSAVKLSMLLIIAPSGRVYKAGNTERVPQTLSRTHHD